MFWQQLDGFWCPDMMGQSIKLQNESPANANNGTSYDFFFVLDTCKHLSLATGRDDCFDETESQAVLEKMYV